MIRFSTLLQYVAKELYTLFILIYQISYSNFRKDTENTAYRIAKKSLKLNLCWRQPSFLRVPKNYEQILEVSGWINFMIHNNSLMSRSKITYIISKLLHFFFIVLPQAKMQEMRSDSEGPIGLLNVWYNGLPKRNLLPSD